MLWTLWCRHGTLHVRHDHEIYRGHDLSWLHLLTVYCPLRQAQTTANPCWVSSSAAVLQEPTGSGFVLVVWAASSPGSPWSLPATASAIQSCYAVRRRAQLAACTARLPTHSHNRQGKLRVQKSHSDCLDIHTTDKVSYGYRCPIVIA